MSDESTMHIGELADRTGLSLRTLRHYDEVGLVSASGRTDGGFRLYTQSDFDRLMLIRRMKPLGFTLDEMRELLSIVGDGASDGAAPSSERLDGFIADANQRRDRLRAQLDMADEFVQLLEAQRGR